MSYQQMQDSIAALTERVDRLEAAQSEGKTTAPKMATVKAPDPDPVTQEPAKATTK